MIVGLPAAAERDLAEDVLDRFRKIFKGLSWVLAELAQGRRLHATTVLDLNRDWEAAEEKSRALRGAIHGVLAQTIALGLIDSTGRVLGAGDEA